MRMLNFSPMRPWRSSRSSIASMSGVWIRSASVSARPQVGRAGQLAGIVETLAEIGLELRLRPFLALLGDDVFEPRMLAVGAVAVVAVQADDGRGCGEEVIGRHEGDRRREARKGLRLVVRHAEAAAECE